MSELIDLLSRNLRGYWCPMLQYGGLVLRDQTRFKNHGTLTNFDATIGNDWIMSRVRGRSGRVLDFDGVNDFVDLGSGLPNTFTSATFSVWYRVGAVNVKQALISSYTASPQGGWGVEQLANNTLNFFGFTNTTQVTDVQSSATVSLGQVVNAVAVFNRGTFQIYVNGLLSGTNTGVASIYKTGSVRLGRTISNEIPFSGGLAEVVIWTSALMPGSAQELYRIGPGWYQPQLPRRIPYSEQQAGFKAYWARRQSQLIGGGV